MKAGRSSRLYGAVLSIVLLVFVAVLLLFMIGLVRTKLLQNTQDLGMALVESYSVEEEMNISNLEKEVILAGNYVDEITSDGGTGEEIQDWLESYFSKLINVMGEGMIDAYAVVDGHIIAANPWEGDESYSYSETEWYRRALEAQGEVVCGEVYTDAITGQRIFTISKELERDGDVFALDVYVQNPALHNTTHSLPEDGSYYLCDENGNLLYAMAKWDIDDDQLQEYANYILSGIADGSLAAYDSFFKDMDGVNRGVYYREMSNGWTVIMTLPVNSILMGERNIVVYVMAVLALALFLVVTLMTVQDILRNRRMKKADDTAHMLGDSFYAIYRVNFRDGTYEAFKAYDDLKSELSKRGDYARLLQGIRAKVKPSTYRAFEVSFSLDSIRQRAAQGIADYGGDYQRRFDDEYRWVNIRTLYDPSITPDEVILCFRDVDEEKRRELQHTIILQEALEEAQKSTRAKSEFFSRMSHDMRTPLNAIIGCCDLAEKSHTEDDHGKVWEYIKKIQFAGNQLLGLINDILELSRMESGKHRLNYEEIDLKALLENTADIFRDRAQEDGKTLEVSLDFRESHVLGDEKKISQIVNNLLSNAIKYSEAGDRIRLEARQFDFQEHSKYQIVVEDTGIGMSESFLEHLFEPYSRETTFSSRSTVGTGLGMAIVKSLVQQMSGEISVQSQLGVGSRFTVTIPLKTVQEPPVDAEKRPIQQPFSEEFDWSGRRILVAEDNELNREIVTEILKQFGAQVLPAVNGAEAVQVFSGTEVYSIDAILMDMQMPQMDGCQAAMAIRHLKRADAGGVPIIAVTANAFAEDIDQTTKAGMNDHVSKPIDSKVLRQTMQKLIGEWDAHRGTSRTKE